MPSSNAVPVGAVHPARYLLRAKDLVDARYAEPLDVGDLAREAGLSRAHFSAEFRRAFGESPHAYLLTRRLERAAALLRTTDHSVADICMSVGPVERRLVHHQLPADVRAVADGVPGEPAARLVAGQDPGLRRACLQPAAEPDVSRRRRRGVVHSLGLVVRPMQLNDGGSDDQDRQRATVGARSG